MTRDFLFFPFCFLFWVVVCVLICGIDGRQSGTMPEAILARHVFSCFVFYMVTRVCWVHTESQGANFVVPHGHTVACQRWDNPYPGPPLRVSAAHSLEKLVNA